MELTKQEVPTRLDKTYLKMHRRNFITKPKNYRTQLCKFHITNSCTKGENCTYSHDLKSFPCKAYHLKKNCTRKNCRFSHKVLSEDELRRLAEDMQSDEIVLLSPLENNN